MATIITGKSLRMVRNDAKVASDTVSASGKVKPGRPVTVTGAKGTMRKYTVDASVAAAIASESNPAKRDALLTNVEGRILDGTRVTVTRDVLAAFVADNLAAVASDPDAPTEAERHAAEARARGFLTAGILPLPDGETGGEDALGWAFGTAEDSDDGESESDADDDDDDAAE